MNTTQSKHISQTRIARTFSAIAATIFFPMAASASPNLVANGDLEQPPEAATSRLSPTENEAIFEIEGERGFGRVIARSHDAARDLKDTLQVGYTQIPGGSRGLLIDASDVKARGGYDISIWFDLRGQIRPNRQYAYNVSIAPSERSTNITLQMIAPAIWADGQLMGAELPLSWTGGNRAEDYRKRGVVRTPDFKYQTGGQSLVLKLPRGFNNRLFITRVSLREVDEALLEGKPSVMPTPTRYIPVDDVIEENVAHALRRSTAALLAAQTEDGFWLANGTEDQVLGTASIVSTLARRGVDLTTRPMRRAMQWLSEQEVTSTWAVSRRLTLFSRYGRDKYRQTIAQDLNRLIDAQFKDGGWNLSAEDDVQDDRRLHSSNVPSLMACMALQEAHYAGFEADIKTWRNAATYWREAQARDGGYRAMMDQYGGLGEATTTPRTAAGLTGLYITLDMAFADGASRCTQYLSNSSHRAKIQRSLNWMDEYYGEYYKRLPTLDTQTTTAFNAWMMIALLQYSGMRDFRDKDVFREEAESILEDYDPTTGLFQGSLFFTNEALFWLNEGAAPMAVQRLILGGSSDFRMSRDATHLVRYLVGQRNKPLNWREAFLETPIEDWVKVPILYIHVAEAFEVNKDFWQKLRKYCFAGGTVVFNIAEDYEPGRDAIEQGLKRAFPEYALKSIGEKDPFWTASEEPMTPVADIRALGNGLKHFAYLLPKDWSCRLNTYQLADHPETFQFFDQLLTYTLDGEEPPSSFAPSTWNSPTYSNMSVKVARKEFGGELPAYPELLDTLDRRMRGEYRLAVETVPFDSMSPETALLWLSCTGPKPMSDAARKTIKKFIDGGGFVFAEVLTGNPSWAEAFRSDLLRIENRIRIRKLPANHPVISGRLYETFGYDVREVPLRRTLREEYDELPRMDAYVVERDGKEVGILSVHDVGSGLGYVQFPNCRGVLPSSSRKVAANLLLYAMQKQVRVD